MLEKLAAVENKYLHLETQLSDPDLVSDMDKWTRVNKEYKGLQPVIDVYREYKMVSGNIDTAKLMMKEEDPEMRDMAEMELESLLPQLQELEEKLKFLMIPKDPDDLKNVIFEIRAGTGGDEAAIFAGDLYRMYIKYFETRGWKTEVLTINEGTVGGYKELVLEIDGNEVYGNLKFESGAHRVQRVPKTESQGRLHTSAATVAVIPIIEAEDINIRKDELRYDTYRSSGAGGQHVNKTESAVRITHIPTGVVSESQDSRSQLKNREIALQRLFQKIQEMQQKEQASSIAANRRSQVGSGDRSEKIRTYNYPQNRVTDHRLEGSNKNFNLQQIVEGNLDPVIEALKLAENAEKMKAEI